jgi:cupin 2 domain-containing protein
MIPEVRNLFTATQPDTGGEVFLKLLKGESFRLESITSRGTASPEGFWYDQSQQEWVLLLRGHASLEFDDQEMIDLVSGDYLLIPMHCRHRVSSVSADAVWLTLHVSGDDLKSDIAFADGQ